MKKNPIIFIAMLVALAFTSCQMNTDDSVVIPPTPTTEATYTITVTYDKTNGSATVTNASGEEITSAKAGENVTLTITPKSGYKFETKINGSDMGYNDSESKSYEVTMPASNVTITVEFVEITDGGSPTTPTTPTDSTQWNLNSSVIKHENGVGKNDGAFHGTITLNKTKANTGDTVTITVTPDSGYELGELFLGPINGEKQSIGKVNSFTMPNYAVGVTARFDPVDGYCVNVEHESQSTFIINTDKSSFAVGEEASFIVRKSYKLNTAKYAIILNGEDISNNFTSIEADKKWTFSMPAHDVVVKVAKRNQ